MRSRRNIATLAALAAALCLLAVPSSGWAAANQSRAKVRVLKLRAPSELARGHRYKLHLRLRNRARHRLRTTVVSTLTRASYGSARIGKRRLRVGRRRKARVSLPVRVPPGLDGGRYRLIACAVSGSRRARSRSCRSRSVRVDSRPGPPAPPVPPSGCAASGYSPGARSAHDPVFPEIGNGGYDVGHYDLTLDYDPTGNRFLTGTRAYITATATSCLSQFSLDFAGLDVGSVEVNGQRAGYARVGDKLVITPSRGLDRGAGFSVEVDYTGVPREIIDPDGSPDGWLRVDTPGQEGAFVVNEPLGSMSWYPNDNTPSDKATFAYHLTVPTDRSAIGNGELVSRTTDGDGDWTWNWRMGYPMATYLSTATVGNFDFGVNIGPITGLPIYNAVSDDNTPAQRDEIDQTLDRQDEIIGELSQLYGLYPFDSAGSVVDQLDGVGYVLEVQTRIHFPERDAVDPITLAHETTHQWFGDAVTAPTWHDLWLQEGMATWAEWWWSSTFEGSGDTPASEFTDNYTPGSGSCPSDKWCIAPRGVTGEQLFDYDPTYLRPAMMIEAEHQILGEAKFRQMIHTWLSRYRYGNGSSAQWIALTKEIDGRSGVSSRWDEFFRRWLDGTSMPQINPSNFNS